VVSDREEAEAVEEVALDAETTSTVDDVEALEESASPEELLGKKAFCEQGDSLASSAMYEP